MAGKKKGRPRKEIGKMEFEALCKLQCTEREICGVFGVCEDTLNAWCKRTYRLTFSEAYKIYSVDGKVSLRRMQFNLAKTSAAMAIFLGKNMLGQRDDPIPTQDDETRERANAQTLAIAELINHPAEERTMDEVESEGEDEPAKGADGA